VPLRRVLVVLVVVAHRTDQQLHVTGEPDKVPRDHLEDHEADGGGRRRQQEAAVDQRAADPAQDVPPWVLAPRQAPEDRQRRQAVEAVGLVLGADRGGRHQGEESVVARPVVPQDADVEEQRAGEPEDVGSVQVPHLRVVDVGGDEDQDRRREQPCAVAVHLAADAVHQHHRGQREQQAHHPREIGQPDDALQLRHLGGIQPQPQRPGEPLEHREVQRGVARVPAVVGPRRERLSPGGGVELVGGPAEPVRHPPVDPDGEQHGGHGQQPQQGQRHRALALRRVRKGGGFRHGSGSSVDLGKKELVRLGGLEPPTKSLGNSCSVHLSYSRTGAGIIAHAPAPVLVTPQYCSSA
jgi:hypothetical protein